MVVWEAGEALPGRWGWEEAGLVECGCCGVDDLSSLESSLSESESLSQEMESEESGRAAPIAFEDWDQWTVKELGGAT